MEGIGVAANVIAVVDISVKILQVCSQYAKEVKGATADIEAFREELVVLRSTAENVRILLDGPRGSKLEASQDLVENIKASQGLLSSLDQKLEPPPKDSLRRRMGLRSLKWPFQSSEVERIIQRIRRCSDAISLALQVDETTVLLDVDLKLEKVDSNMVMASLPEAAGAAYNSFAEEHNSTCLKNTRSELLQEIDNWANDNQSQTIFWLKGMAGTGKSTIARTMASKWDGTGCLGATFFFKRGGGDRASLSRFYTTIARQLVFSVPALGPHVKAAVDQDASITSKIAEQQFDKLILQPLLQLKAANRTIITIVIDALDECQDDSGIKRLISLLTRSKTVMEVRIRVLITSRPELPIRLGFNAILGSYQDFVLHEIPESVIARDIELFFRERLDEIRHNYNSSVDEHRRLSDSWPGPDNTLALVRKAIPLFIFAATVCRFISQRNCADPEKQLQKVLEHETKSQESKLDATYLPPLEQQLEGLSLREQDEVLSEFHQVVGTVVLLETPLTVTALAYLIEMSEDTIYGRLDVLHSVLDFPRTGNSPIRLLHLSFRDFLLDSEKRGNNKFWVDEKKAHERIASGCLRTMACCLKEDLCNLVAPGTRRSSISDSHITASISMEVQYACRYWVYHLEKSEKALNKENEVISLLDSHFLHWLEVLSLIGRFGEVFPMVKILQSIVKDQAGTKLKQLLEEIHRFIQMNFAIIDQYPLQLYSSLLCTLPSNSLLFSLFSTNTPHWILQLPQPSQLWDQRRLVLEGHDTLVAAVSFSPDDSHLVSLCKSGTIRIWRLDTGECIRQIFNDESFVESRRYALELSADLEWIALGTDVALYIWRGDKGELAGEYALCDKYGPICQISPNSELIAFLNSSEQVVILNLRTMRQSYLQSYKSICNGWLSGYNPNPLIMVFSHHSQHLTVLPRASPQSYAIWDIRTSQCIDKHHENEVGLEGHAISAAWTNESSISVVCVVPNERIAFVIWPQSEGNTIVHLDGPQGDIITARFLRDHTTLGGISLKGEIQTWDVDTGKCLTGSTIEQDPYSSVPSADYSMLASFNTGKTISIWEISSEWKGSQDRVVAITLSADRALSASITESGIISLWDFQTLKLIRRFDSGAVANRTVNTGIFEFTASAEYLLLYDRTLYRLHKPNSRGQLEVWEVKTGLRVRSFEIHMALRRERDSLSPLLFLATILGRAISLSEDGHRIALILKTRVVVVEVGTMAYRDEYHLPGNVYDTKFSPDSNILFILASKVADDTTEDHLAVYVYNAQNATCIGTLTPSRIVIGVLGAFMDSKFAVLHTRAPQDNGSGWIEVIRIDTGETERQFDIGTGFKEVHLSSDLTTAVWQSFGRLTIADLSTERVMQRLTPNRFPVRLSLDAGGSRMSTSFGDFLIDKTQGVSGKETNFDDLDLVGYGISDDKSWISWNNTNIFWLPPSLRPERKCIEVSGSTVMIGTSSGRVLFLRFDVEELLEKSIDPTGSRRQA